jgi:hypothetical protein
VVTVAREYQNGCDNVMREHLPIVLSPFLDIDDHHLLEPESILNQSVPLLQSPNLSIWPVGPELFHIKPVVRVDIDVLISLVVFFLNRVACVPFPESKIWSRISEAKPAQQI